MKYRYSPYITKMVMPATAISDLRRLCAQDFSAGRMAPGAVSHILEVCDALWLHSGDNADPHAELTTGLCSDGYANCAVPLSIPNLVEIFARQLIMAGDLGSRGYDWTVSSDHSGAVLGHEVARQLGTRFDFSAKGPDKTQLWKRFQIEEGAKVLHVEELMTTSKTAVAVRKGIQDAHSYPIDFGDRLLCLVHRSDEYSVGGSEVKYVAHFDINVWEPAKCPLCAKGSKRLKPKSHWAELTGQAAA